MEPQSVEKTVFCPGPGYGLWEFNDIEELLRHLPRLQTVCGSSHCLVWAAFDKFALHLCWSLVG